MLTLHSFYRWRHWSPENGINLIKVTLLFWWPKYGRMSLRSKIHHLAKGVPLPCDLGKGFRGFLPSILPLFLSLSTHTYTHMYDNFTSWCFCSCLSPMIITYPPYKVLVEFGQSLSSLNMGGEGRMFDLSRHDFSKGIIIMARGWMMGLQRESWERTPVFRDGISRACLEDDELVPLWHDQLYRARVRVT